MSIALVGIISVNGIDYSVIDQDISIQEYAAGDLVRWTRDGVTVATTPTFRVSEADVRDDGSLALIRGYLKKPTDTAYQTHLKPVCPIIYPTRMGMPDATGRRVDAWGKPFLKLRPASVDGHVAPITTSPWGAARAMFSSMALPEAIRPMMAVRRGLAINAS